MSTAELTEQSTTEEVNKKVEQIAKEVEAERVASEDKGDARITSEHADNEHPEAPAETDSGSEDTAGKGEEQAKADTGESEGQDWLDDDLKAELAAYGIKESELADFTSREELERALRFFDRSALEAGRRAMAESDKGEAQGKQETESAHDEQRRFTEKEPKEGQYEVKLPNRELFDEDLAKDLVEEFTAIRDHYESRFDALEARFMEANARVEEQQFDSLVDSLGHADLFGATGKENTKQLQRRQDLHVAVKAQQIGLESLGRGVDLDKSLVNRVARMVFAEDLGKKDLKKHTRKISKQANSRQGGGVTRASDPREDPRDEFDRKFREMDGNG